MEKCYGVAFFSSDIDHANTFIFGTCDDELRAHAFHQFILKKFHKVMSDFYRELDDSWAIPFDYGSAIEEFRNVKNSQFRAIYNTIETKYQKRFTDIMKAHITVDQCLYAWMDITSAYGTCAFEILTLNKL